jgi:hypothetical protein
MMPLTVGVWRRAGALVASVVESDGRRVHSLLNIARIDDQYWSCLDELEREVGLDFDLVLPEDLVCTDALASIALERRISIWVVPRSLVAAIRALLGTGPPLRMATAIARLPLAPALRGHLRRLAPPDRRQLCLL